MTQASTNKGVWGLQLPAKAPDQIQTTIFFFSLTNFKTKCPREAGLKQSRVLICDRAPSGGSSSLLSVAEAVGAEDKSGAADVWSVHIGRH